MEQSRWRSPVVWSAIAAQVISLFQITGLFEKMGIDAGLVGDVIAGVLQLAVIVGILNSPTSKDRF